MMITPRGTTFSTEKQHLVDIATGNQVGSSNGVSQGGSLGNSKKHGSNNTTVTNSIGLPRVSVG